MCITVLMPNLRTYSYIEVSGHNLERVLRLEVSVLISSTIGKGVWFSISFPSFLLYGNCKRWREFEVTINVPVVYMVRYKVVLRGDYP